MVDENHLLLIHLAAIAVLDSAVPLNVLIRLTITTLGTVILFMCRTDLCDCEECIFFAEVASFASMSMST